MKMPWISLLSQQNIIFKNPEIKFEFNEYTTWHDMTVKKTFLFKFIDAVERKTFFSPLSP